MKTKLQTVVQALSDCAVLDDLRLPAITIVAQAALDALGIKGNEVDIQRQADPLFNWSDA